MLSCVNRKQVRDPETYNKITFSYYINNIIIIMVFYSVLLKRIVYIIIIVEPH